MSPRGWFGSQGGQGGLEVSASFGFFGFFYEEVMLERRMAAMEIAGMDQSEGQAGFQG